MTGERFARPRVGFVPGALLSALLATGCGGGASSCVGCEALEGRYALELGAGVTPGSCQGVTVTLPRGPLEMTHEGGALVATLDGLTLRGSLYTTNDFNLLGSRPVTSGPGTGGADGGTGGGADGGTPGAPAGLESASLTGRYVAGVGDGGVARLIGDWQGNFASTSTGTTRRCSVTRPYTATRQ